MLLESPPPRGVEHAFSLWNSQPGFRAGYKNKEVDTKIKKLKQKIKNFLNYGLRLKLRLWKKAGMGREEGKISWT